ncbi:MAG: helix-turn-helix domain-containing protein [Gammaproteobacteria bacterium]|nr:helix-turn-helix domain-containing protein [Gammaproteobacteria bacterium]
MGATVAKKPRKNGKDGDKGKHAGGRPSKFKPEYTKQAYYLGLKGFTDDEVAEIFGVTTRTIHKWKKDFPQFFHSLKKGKAVADQKVVQSLYQRALGYSHPEVHISANKGVVVKTNVIKHYPPDTTACIFWLKNRDRENWRDRQQHEITGEDGGPLEVNVTVTKTYKKEDDGNS